MSRIEIYDTTLRDGSQSEDISLSLDDKITIVTRLDQLGLHYIEAGWPGANPKDERLFAKIKSLPIKNARIMAFGSTCKPGAHPEHDRLLRSIINAKPYGVTIFGKSWDTHVKGVGGLGCTLDENLRMISDTIAYLKGFFPAVFFDAEHFFDGVKANRDYALSALRAACDGGADRVVLCDTNGGALPSEVRDIIDCLKGEIRTPLGIHCHNDGDLAVANTVCAVQEGVDHIHGTINGVGERCGNTNLCSIIPNLTLKLGHETIPVENMRMLSDVSRFFDDIANLSHNKHQPFVGEAAFAHKGGVHVSAVMGDPTTYEHVSPEIVGNQRKVLVSEHSGKSNILYKAREFNIDLSKDDTTANEIVKSIKDLEDCGFQFEGADASLELLMKKALGEHMRSFRLKGFRVNTERRSDDTDPVSEATIMIEVDGNVEHTAALGNGPVNALDRALRKALMKFYPGIQEVELLDYKVRVISSRQGTESVVRVLIESGDKKDHWYTVGVSSNILEASWMALVDSMDYKLYKDMHKGGSHKKHR
ncbi:MAG TPA: citramalate synthase [Deltaproteobacteria bacterium]|nr:citramalate synthase [Deltaproteobacteria bacterium]HPR54371.1 citramalate synthase [Deltaproteobacteria bacterium]HXK46990.1 citramalate synthase [Deltaproteobacteria bacterium]